MRIETTILKSLISSENYSRRVLPFLHEEYFTGVDAKLFIQLKEFFIKYNTRPTFESIGVDLQNSDKFNELEFKAVVGLLDEISKNKDEPVNEEWLIDRTEEFCKDRAIYNAVAGSVAILEGKDKVHDRGAIPKILQDALGVSFDTNIGHDYIADADERFEYYHRPTKKYPFDIAYLNKITKGGFEPKTLNIFMGGTNVGKTLVMCHLAAAYLAQSYNVLYITLEMSQEKIAERIDANLLNVTLDDLILLPKDDFDRRLGKVANKTTGKLKIKEYPTAGASVMHFRALLNDLSLKQNYVPDIVIIDYINICISSRIRMGGSVNSYSYIKAIGEELRGLAVEMNLPVITATQFNRSGFASSDPGMEDTSESMATNFTADFVCAIMQPEQLANLNQYLFKQLKSRYGDVNNYRRFVVGVDKPKMRLFDLEDSAQQNISSLVGQDYSQIPKQDSKKGDSSDKPINTFGDRERLSSWDKEKGKDVHW